MTLKLIIITFSFGRVKGLNLMLLILRSKYPIKNYLLDFKLCLLFSSEKEIEELINGILKTKIPLSPSAYYLNIQNLNDDEKQYVDSYDKKLLEKFRKSKSEILLSSEGSPIDKELKKKINILKEQKKTFQFQSFENENEKSIEKVNDSPKENMKPQSNESLKELLKETIEDKPPKFNL